MCTSINVIAKDGYHVLGRTMDWDDLLVSPIFTPRHYQWASVFDHQVHENPYAIIGGGSITERRTDVSDGVNEFGLMAQKLTFKNGARLVDERHPDKVQPPGAYTPKGRYVRAAYMKELADQPASKDEALATTWHLLDSVTVPKSKAHRPTFSVYRAATVAEDRTYYFQSYHQAQVTSVKLTDDLLKRSTPLVFDTADVWAPVELN